MMKVNLTGLKMAYVNASRDIEATISRVDEDTIELDVRCNDGWNTYATINRDDERWSDTLKLVEGLESLGYWYTH